MIRGRTIKICLAASTILLVGLVIGSVVGEKFLSHSSRMLEQISTDVAYASPDPTFQIVYFLSEDGEGILAGIFCDTTNRMGELRIPYGEHMGLNEFTARPVIVVTPYPVKPGLFLGIYRAGTTEAVIVVKDAQNRRIGDRQLCLHFMAMAPYRVE